MVQRDSRMGEVFPKQAMAAYRRGPSLKDLLCRAKLPQVLRKSARQAEVTTRVYLLWNHVCALPHMVAGKEFRINGRITCGSTGCVYKITCQKRRGFVYYGETGRQLRTRFREHSYDIANSKPKASIGTFQFARTHSCGLGIYRNWESHANKWHFPKETARIILYWKR